MKIITKIFILFIFIIAISCHKEKNIATQTTTAESVHYTDPVNGHIELAYKTYDKVVYPTTHNSYNHADDPIFQFPNQQYGITQQLNDGIRAVMLDVYLDTTTNTVVQYHGFPFTGKEPFANNLAEIKSFLDSNRNEIVTIILECYVTSDKINASLDSAGLIKYLYSKESGKPWQRLGDMVKENKRLVIFSDKNDANGLSWYHYVWDYAVETSFSVHQLNEFNCGYNRGTPSNDLFILNHFITDVTYGFGVDSLATQANTNPFLLNRARECMTVTGKLPNFVTVDFYASGDVFKTVDSLNLK